MSTLRAMGWLIHIAQLGQRHDGINTTAHTLIELNRRHLPDPVSRPASYVDMKALFQANKNTTILSFS